MIRGAGLRKPDTTLTAGLAGLAATVAGLAVFAWIGVRVNTWALDETVIKQSAVHYTSGLPHTLFHDVNARGTSRGYSLILAPLFATLDGLQAVRLSHVVNVVLWLTGLVPALAMARRLLTSRWLSVVAAVVVVLVPWATLTTALFTENLAYPLFLWACWAILRALWSPSWANDLLALVLACATAGARVQLAALVPAYWLAILVTQGGRASGSWAMVWRPLRHFPVAGAALAVTVIVAVKLQLSGQLHTKLASLLGGYSEIQDRPIVPTDYVKGMLAQAEALAIGIGIVPGAVGLEWLRRTLLRPGDATRRDDGIFARAAVLIVLVVAGIAMYAQNGFLGPHTEERYFIYCVPLVLLAAFTALDRRQVAVGPTLAWIGLLACVVSLIGLPTPPSTELAFLAPVNTSVNLISSRVVSHLNVGGLAGTDVIFWAVVVFGLVWALAWRWFPRARVAVTVAMGISLQAAVTGVAIAAISGSFHEVTGRVGSIGNVSWIDRAVGGRSVVWINNQPRPADGSADVVQRTTLYYNDQIRAVIHDDSLGLPAVNFPLDTLSIVQRNTIKPGGLGDQDIVQVAHSPFLQLAGTQIAQDRDSGLELLRPDPALAVRWRMLGAAADGTLTARVRWQAAPDTQDALTLRSNGDALVAIVTGGVRRVLGVGGERVVRLTSCRNGTIAVLHGSVVAAGVDVAPTDAARCTTRG